MCVCYGDHPVFPGQFQNLQVTKQVKNLILILIHCCRLNQYEHNQWQSPRMSLGTLLCVS